MKKRHRAEQIVLLRREVDVEPVKGEMVPGACWKLGILKEWRLEARLMRWLRLTASQRSR